METNSNFHNFKMKITNKHRNYFNSFGFIKLKSFFPSDYFSYLLESFDIAMFSLKNEDAENSLFNKSKLFMSEETSILCSLIDNENFIKIAESLLQREVIGISIAGNFFMGDTEWHSDNYNLNYDSVKFLIYFDSLNKSNGALRVIPGSQNDPLWRLSKLNYETEKIFGVKPSQLPSYVITSEPGDVIIFRHSIWHASFYGENFRRALEINYYANPVSSNEIEAFKIQMMNNHAPSMQLGLQLYSDYWRKLPLTKHQNWIKRLKELNILDTPKISKKSRLKT